jgi:hypothetical protein
MKLSTPLMASVIFAALTIVGVGFVVAGTAGATAALPPIGAGLVGGALAYFLLELSAWDRSHHEAR